MFGSTAVSAVGTVGVSPADPLLTLINGRDARLPYRQDAFATKAPQLSTRDGEEDCRHPA